jgi:hypothetical protein
MPPNDAAFTYGMPLAEIKSCNTLHVIRNITENGEGSSAYEVVMEVRKCV